ncbi:hypothetical protein BDR26DRAFT_1010785 [Obelidium mucronatum]|nr:hypothetical protein BDR26DRAFT_1010785 [Obelidium mucronatum]
MTHHSLFAPPSYKTPPVPLQEVLYQLFTRKQKEKNHKMPSMRIPLEVYPIIAMIGTALTFGTYVAQKEIRTGQDLRIGDRTYNPDHWQTRLNRDASSSERTPFGNFFYKHIKD